jgi:hypothetical protein
MRSMYLAYPAKVPTAAADVPEAGVAIEMGGFVRLDGTTFRRQIVHYSKSGKVRASRTGPPDLQLWHRSSYRVIVDMSGPHAGDTKLACWQRPLHQAGQIRGS